MKLKNRLGYLSALMLLTASVIIPCNVEAAQSLVPYESYEYNSNDVSVAAPDGYTLKKTVDSKALGLDTEMKEPSDITVDANGNIWILDSGNSRIITTDSDYKVKRVMDSFADAGSGEQIEFAKASGFAIKSDGTIYIADTDNQRILVSDKDGNIGLKINKPDTGLLDDNIMCNYTKILVDSENRIYAIADDVNIGAMVFAQDGEFKTFYGSNPVVKTADVIKKYIMRRFMSKTQLKGSLQYTAANFSNFDISDDGYIFTVTKDQNNSEVTSGMVRKLNISGGNILVDGDERTFGDLEFNTEYDSPGGTKLTDIEIDSNGFIYLLDSTRGRVFLYSQQDGIMMSAFGGLGNQKGMFKNPTAIETVGDSVLVLDKERACIYVFEPTEYMQVFKSGVIRLENGDYDGALELFRRILSFNTNNETAYLGIGKALDAQGEYRQAMSYFKKAYAQKDYSHSFEEYRKIFVRKNFIPLVAGVVLFVVLLAFVTGKIKKKLALKEGEAYSGWETREMFPIYVMKHPADGFAQFRTRKIMSWPICIIILIVWFLIEATNYFCLGFPFNDNRPENYRLIYTLLQTIGVFCLFVCANYAICTLLEGKGTFKEICAGVSYSLLPMLLCKVIALIMSQFMAINEGTFINIVLWLGILWTAFLLFTALSTIHQYSFGKTIICVLLTIIGMGVVLFLIILFYSLLSQLFGFLQSIKTEISLR